MIIEPKLCSWVKDPQHKNQHEFLHNQLDGYIVVPNTNNVDLRQYASPIEQQATLNSCVGNSVVGGLELLQNVYGLPKADLSRLFIYYNARNEHGAILEDNGTIIRLALSQLKNLGVCTEIAWPYDPFKVFVRPSWNAYREAYVHKIKQFYRLDQDDSDFFVKLNKALQAKCPVVFGMCIDKAFVENTQETYILTNTPEWVGRHAMLIVGYCGEYYILRNSWGLGWGNNGYCLVHRSIFHKSDANDFWVMHGVN